MEGGDGRDKHQKRHDAIVATMTPEHREANREAFEAIEQGDVRRLQGLLASNLIGPDDYLIAAQERAATTPIRRDKPGILGLLVRSGASNEIPADEAWIDQKTYAGFARWLAAESRKDDVARERRKNGFGPVSDALLDVVARWEGRAIPLATDAPRRTGPTEWRP